MKLYTVQSYCEVLGSPSSVSTGKIFVFDSIEKRNEFIDIWISRTEKYCTKEADYLYYSDNLKHWLEFDEPELNTTEL